MKDEPARATVDRVLHLFPAVFEHQKNSIFALIVAVRAALKERLITTWDLARTEHDLHRESLTAVRYILVGKRKRDRVARAKTDAFGLRRSPGGPTCVLAAHRIGKTRCGGRQAGEVPSVPQFCGVG